MTDARLIDRLKASFAERRTEVEIFGMRVWTTPLTLAEQNTINAMHPTDGGARMAEILVRKCRDEAGEPVFTKDDKDALRRQVAGDDLAPLIVAIVGRSAAEQEKNSETDDQ